MAKRFTATEKWDDPWFHSLTKDERLLWGYLTDKCDIAGIWDPNLRQMFFQTGVTRYDLKKFEGRVIVLPTGKWFIPGFLTFQYGTLTEKSRFHVMIINRLKTLNLWPIPPELLAPKVGVSIPLGGGIGHPVDTPGEGYKTKTRTKGVGPSSEETNTHVRASIKATDDQNFDRFWLLYPKHVDKQDTIRFWEKLNPDEALRAEMYAAIEKQKKSDQWTRDDGRYIPNPATWLNKRKWEDELPMGTAKVEEDDWKIAKTTAKH